MEERKVYRVLRVLEYIGDIEWIENTLNKSSVPLNGDSRIFSGDKNYIKSGMIGNFPEHIETIIRSAEKEQNKAIKKNHN